MGKLAHFSFGIWFIPTMSGPPRIMQSREYLEYGWRHRRRQKRGGGGKQVASLPRKKDERDERARLHPSIPSAALPTNQKKLSSPLANFFPPPPSSSSSSSSHSSPFSLFRPRLASGYTSTQKGGDPLGARGNWASRLPRRRRIRHRTVVCPQNPNRRDFRPRMELRGRGQKNRVGRRGGEEAPSPDCDGNWLQNEEGEGEREKVFALFPRGVFFSFSPSLSLSLSTRLRYIPHIGEAKVIYGGSEEGFPIFCV